MPDDMKTEYHPRSGIPTKIERFEEFRQKRQAAGPTSRDDVLTDPQPWRPFKTRTDFEFAELVHEANLSKKKVKRMIRIIRRVSQSPEFTLKTYEDIKEKWESAAKQHTVVSALSSSLHASRDIFNSYMTSSSSTILSPPNITERTTNTISVAWTFGSGPWIYSTTLPSQNTSTMMRRSFSNGTENLGCVSSTSHGPQTGGSNFKYVSILVSLLLASWDVVAHHAALFACSNDFFAYFCIPFASRSLCHVISRIISTFVLMHCP